MNFSRDDGRQGGTPGRSALIVCALLLSACFTPARGDFWQQRAPVPGARAAHSAVWTGREMIVWGGGIDGSFLNTGARYTPATDTWRTTSPYGAPAPRWFHAAVWTGSEMIIWGGRANFSGNNNYNDGARYDPTTDTWTPISGYGAPTARSQCAAVWTGEEMVIWGGATEDGVPLADGAAYNPATDEWRPINSASGLASRMEPTSVWTGSEMIIFGGVDATQPGWLSYGDGARYNPFTDSWTPLPTSGAPGSRTGHTAVWTGERMIVWGGRALPSYSMVNDGAIYHPGADSWTPIPFSYDAPQARMLHAAVWTGTEMIIWGGQADEAGTLLNTGARYNPATAAWTATPQDDAAGKRMFWRPDLGIWTGRGLLVCAGSDYPASLDSTYLYSLFDPPCPPVIREQPQSVTAMVGEAVTLAVGAQDCAASLSRSASQISTGPGAAEFVFETGARSGQLQFDFQFYSIPDSLRVYYDGERIYDDVLSGDGTVRVTFGPGTAQSVRIVINEESGAQPGTAWEYTVRFRPPPLRYQWRKNGAVLEGQTDATLHFASVSFEDAGDYSVMVANNNSSTASEFATLTVRPHPPTNCIPGLVAWWRGEGDARDATGAHDGELLYGTTFAPGVVGQAFSFDLSRARVSIPDHDAFKLTDSLSFEGWIKVASYAPGLLFIRGDNRGGLDPYHMSMQPSGQLYWGINTAENNYVGLYSPGVVPTDVWLHVAATLDGATGNMGLYVNGSLVNQTNTSLRPLRDLDPNSEPALGIGNHGGTFHHFPFHGLVDEWALYSRALSSAEILAIYQAGAAGKCSGTNPPPPLAAYDASADFSPASNPAGAWSYGYTATLGGSFHLLTFAKSFAANNGVPISAWQVSDVLAPTVNRVMGPGVAMSEGGAFTAPPGTVYVWPGNDGSPGNFGVIRFTVPAGGAGVYRIESAVRPTFDGPTSGDTDYHILRNGQELFGQFLGPNAGTSSSNLVALGAGDVIDFVVGRGADGSPDHSSLKVQAALALVTNAPPPQPTNCASVPAGLVAWWRGNGDARDATGMHDGTLLYGTTFSPGVVGQAFSFDLSRARVSIPDDDAFKLTNSLSFEGWINVASYAPGLIFIRGDNRGGLDPYHMSMQPSGQLHWGINTAENTFTALDSPTAVPTGVWLHVAAVLDGVTGNMGLYVNGVLVTQTNTTMRPLRDLDPNSEPALGIGNHGGTFHHFPFHGLVDEWALYSRALSAAEILAIYQAGSAGKCAATNPSPSSRVFDLSADFSLAANPNGPWSYGHRTNLLGTGFQLLNTMRTFGAENGVPIDIWQWNNTKPWVAKVIGPDTAVSFHFNAPAGTIYFGPDPDARPGDFAVIRFTVPPGAGGMYRLATAVRSLYDGTRSVDADFHVIRNGRELFGEVVPPNSGTGYSNVLTLAVGDRIDFIAGRGPNGLPETGLKIQAALTSVAEMAMSIGSTMPLSNGSGVRVTGTAPPGTSCRVQRSINLIDWMDAGSVTAAPNGAFEFTDLKPSAGPACFYRLRGAGQ